MSVRNLSTLLKPERSHQIFGTLGALGLLEVHAIIRGHTPPHPPSSLLPLIPFPSGPVSQHTPTPALPLNTLRLQGSLFPNLCNYVTHSLTHSHPHAHTLKKILDACLAILWPSIYHVKVTLVLKNIILLPFLFKVSLRCTMFTPYCSVVLNVAFSLEWNFSKSLSDGVKLWHVPNNVFIHVSEAIHCNISPYIKPQQMSWKCFCTQALPLSCSFRNLYMYICWFLHIWDSRIM